MCIQSTCKPLTRNLIFKHSKAKFMKKLTVKLGLLFALTAILFTACQKDTLVNNAVENVQVEASENIDYRNSCGGITVSTSGLTVTLTSNSNSANTIVTITTQDWSYSDLLCNDHTGDDCMPGSSLTLPNAGNYVVHVQTGGGTVNCSFNITVGGCTTDNDGDGICGDVDCNDNDASVGAAQQPGTACDDGNPNTSNDVIQADGCTCVGSSGCPLVISQCDIVVCVSGQTITLLESNSPASPPFTIVTVTDPFWNFVKILCNDHVGNNCVLGKSVTVPFSGPYVIHVQSGGGNCTIDVQI